MKITVVGLGYIGLPTAAMLAQAGHVVFGYDTDAERRSAITSDSFAAEPEVREIVTQALLSSRLRVIDHLSFSSDAFIICVPTPTNGHRPDLSYVEAATAAVSPALRTGDALILESTVPPGTMERVVVRTLERMGNDADNYRIAHCPERVMPGCIVHELRTNARVIGGRRPGDAEYVRSIYESFVTASINVTDCMTAELVKVVENTFRDVNIAFANELALLCEELGVDVWDAIRLANEHPRVTILSPGPGVGGHCIPVDPHFLSNANPFVTELIQTARRINERMPEVMVRRIETLTVRAPRSATITLLGAAYKPNVDDTRESPTARIDELLRERGYRTRIYDPLVSSFSRPLCKSLHEAACESDALVLLTEHDIFKSIDPVKISGEMRDRLLICGRPALDRERWNVAGFRVYTLGAAASLHSSIVRPSRRPSLAES